MPYFRDAAADISPDLDMDCYTLWLDAVDHGYPRPYVEFMAGLAQLHALTAAALVWCEDNSDDITHSPQYTRIRRLRAELKLPRYA